MTPAPIIPQDLARALQLSQAPDLKHIGYWREAERPDVSTGYHGSRVASCLEQQAKLAHGESLGYCSSVGPDGWGPYLEREIRRETKRRDLMAQLPWPGDHCDPAMSQAERERIANALNAIVPTMHYVSPSWDRLSWPAEGAKPWECLFFQGIGLGEVQRNGWVWPQGLCVYVYRHGLVLPVEFLADVLPEVDHA
jgi:hypothetical protein